MRNLLIAGTLFSTALGLSAQDPQPGKYQEAIEVSIVNLDVVVTDKSGKPVHGLTAADFEVRDGGKPQAITNFAEYSSAEGELSAEGPQAQPQAAPALPATPSNDKRTVVLFIESFRLPQKQTEVFFEEIRKLLHEVIRPGDAAAIVSWNYVMKVRQDFTGDLARLDQALDAVKAGVLGTEDNSENRVLENAFIQEMLDRATLSQEGTPVQSEVLSGVESARRAMIDIRRKSAALNTLINTMAGAQGKKVLMVATNRYSQYAGAEYFDGVLPQEWRAEFDTFDVRSEVAANANASGVTIYAIYPRGADQVVFANVEQQDRSYERTVTARGGGSTTSLMADQMRQLDTNRLGRSGMVLMNETAAIDELAKQTGGVAAWGQTDIVRLARIMREDIGSWYSIGFRSAEGGGARKVSVTTKDRSYRVRTRREYVPKSDAMQMSERVRTSMYRRIEPPKLTFEVRTGDARRNKRHYLIPVEVRVPVAELTTLPEGEGRSGTFSVFTAAGGQLGVMSNVTEQAQAFAIKPGDEQRATASVLTYKVEVVADGRADRIAVGVLDETSKEWGVVVVKLAKE